MQRAGEAVHINVQLINGRDDTHVWAESYDRELKKVFEVEREVAETVAGKLKAQLSPQDTKELSRVPIRIPRLMIDISEALTPKLKSRRGARAASNRQSSSSRRRSP